MQIETDKVQISHTIVYVGPNWRLEFLRKFAVTVTLSSGIVKKVFGSFALSKVTVPTVIFTVSPPIIHGAAAMGGGRFPKGTAAALGYRGL